MACMSFSRSALRDWFTASIWLSRTRAVLDWVRIRSTSTKRMSFLSVDWEKQPLPQRPRASATESRTLFIRLFPSLAQTCRAEKSSRFCPPVKKKEGLRFMPGSGRREWGHPGQAHAPAGPLRRARQASSLKSILPAHVIRNAASCPVCVERRHSSSSHRRSLRPKSPPQAGGGRTGSPRTIRKERLLRADSFGRTASPDAKKPPSREKTEVFRIFSEAGAYCTLSLGIPLPMGPYWAS